MRDTILKLDDINEELKKALQINGEKASISEKWLTVFDTIIVDIIETRKVVDFARGEKKIDWEFVLEAIKKDLSS